MASTLFIKIELQFALGLPYKIGPPLGSIGKHHMDPTQDIIDKYNFGAINLLLIIIVAFKMFNSECINK